MGSLGHSVNQANGENKFIYLKKKKRTRQRTLENADSFWTQTQRNQTTENESVTYPAIAACPVDLRRGPTSLWVSRMWTWKAGENGASLQGGLGMRITPDETLWSGAIRSGVPGTEEVSLRSWDILLPPSDTHGIQATENWGVDEGYLADIVGRMREGEIAAGPVN